MEPHWYRLHWVTAGALLLVGGCLAWSDFIGSHRSLKYLWVGTRSFGWPWEHFDGVSEFSPSRAVANLMVSSLILVGVATELQALLRTPTGKPQFRLISLLLITAVLATLMALVKSEADWLREWNLGHYVPLSWYPLPVRGGIMVGLGCALFAAVRLAVRLVGRLVNRAMKPIA